MTNRALVQVTNFNINSDVTAKRFETRDLEIQNEYLSKLDGYINRHLYVNDQGTYLLMTYWATLPLADAAVVGFIKDESLSDYTPMVEKESLDKVKYYVSVEEIDFSKLDDCQFVVLKSFDLKPGVNEEDFDMLNKKIGSSFSNNNDAFVKRVLGKSAEGRQIIIGYWTSEKGAESSSKEFKADEDTKMFTSQMNEEGLSSGKFNLLY